MNNSNSLNAVSAVLGAPAISAIAGPTSSAGATAHDIMEKMIAACVVTGAKPFPAMAHRMPFVSSANLLETPEISELAAMVAALRAPAIPAKAGAKLVTLMNVVLDESGSMSMGVAQTMKGYNDALATLRPSAEEIGCLVTQVVFSTTGRVIGKDLRAKDIVPLSNETYMPNGGTALFDTVAGVIKQMLAHPLANDDNTSILLSITTDGDDTTSMTWKCNEMGEFRALMKAVSENDRWTVALSGPDLALRKFADLMSVSPANVAAFKPDSVASRVVASGSTVQAMGNYSAMRSSGMKKVDTMYAGTESNVTAMAILNAGK